MSVLISIATEEDSGSWAEALRHSPWLNVSDYPDCAGFSYFPAPETPAAELEAVAGVVLAGEGLFHSGTVTP